MMTVPCMLCECWCLPVSLRNLGIGQVGDSIGLLFWTIPKMNQKYIVWMCRSTKLAKILVKSIWFLLVNYQVATKIGQPNCIWVTKSIQVSSI